MDDEIVPISKEQQKMQQKEAQQRNMAVQGSHRPLTDVTCFKCGDRGHYGKELLRFSKQLYQTIAF